MTIQVHFSGKWQVITVLSFLLAVPISVQGGIFGPSSYEDCVLEGLKTAKTENAVSSLHYVCRKKFPEQKRVVEKVRCGKNLFDPNESASVSFEVPLSSPTRNFQVKTSRVIRIDNKIEIFLQSDLPFSIVQVKVSALAKPNDPQSVEDYLCSGISHPGTIGKFTCESVHPKTQYYVVREIVSSDINLLKTFRNLGFCK